MDYELDLKLNKDLRDAYNHSHFASMQEAEFNKPSSKKRTTYEANASNCICACLDRIDSLVSHINDLFEENDSEYKICDILSYGQTLIDCISVSGSLTTTVLPTTFTFTSLTSIPALISAVYDIV